MLESIRASAQSFWVKVAFGLIILVFVFWGVGNFNDRDYSNVVAMVDGEPITAREFEKAYRDAEEYILHNNPGVTREMLIKQHLGRQVLRDLIHAALVAQEARRAGISVTPLELRDAVGEMKAFQDDAGKFDPEAYKRVLAAQRLTPADFEKDLAARILRDKMFAIITAPAWVDPDEALNRYNYLRERRLIDYIFLPAAKFMKTAQVSEADARAWYEDHLQQFAIPAKVNVDYIKLVPADLVDVKSIGDDAARAWYEGAKNRFEVQEGVRVAHILAPLAENADAEAERAANERIGRAKAALAEGKAFADVANEFNTEGAAGPGGELGWISRGETAPTFEEAAFALEPGVVSEVIRTPFGLHLILVEEKRAAGFKSFADAKAEVLAEMAREEGADKLHDALDNLIEDNILNKSLQESAARYGLKTGQTGLLDKDALMGALGVNAAGADALLALEKGMPLDTALEGGDQYIIARVIETSPAGTRPFADVKGEVEEKLKSEKALELAMAEAAKVLEKVRGQSLEQIKGEFSDFRIGEGVDRGAVPTGFAPNQALSEALFNAKPGSWLSRPFPETDSSGSGALLARVDKALPPEATEFESVREIMGNAVKNERVEGLYSLFVTNLASKAKVEVTNQNFVDRVNM